MTGPAEAQATHEALERLSRISKPDRRALYASLIDQALQYYDIPIRSSEQVTFLRSMLVCSGGATYRLDGPYGQAYTLRIHNPVPIIPDQRHEMASVESGRIWLEALADAGLDVQRPVRNRDGRLVTELPGPPDSEETIRVTIVQWIEGKPERDRGPDHWRAIGRTMAVLHDHAAEWDRPDDFQLMRTDGDTVDLWLDRIRWAVTSGRLTTDELEMVETACDHVRATMGAQGEGAAVWGPIHGDLGFWGNCVYHGSDARAIDFNSCVFGHYLFELGHTMCWSRDVRNRRALLEGYGELRTVPGLDDVEVMFMASRIRHLSGFALNPTEDLVNERKFIPTELRPFTNGQSFLMRRSDG